MLGELINISCLGASGQHVTTNWRVLYNLNYLTRNSCTVLEYFNDILKWRPDNLIVTAGLQ